MRTLSVVLSALLLAACSSVPERPAASSYGCMQAARAAAPQFADDKQQHCVTAALIAQQCSATEAWLAGLGKELHDLFGSGDAAWSDWQADRRGIACAKLSSDPASLQGCCTQARR